MGGKKKTKWRKLPLEELSDVTVREKAKDAMQLKDHNPTGTSHSCAESELKSDAGPDTAGGEKYRIEPGFYINGLWLPMAELENSIPPCSNLPLNIVNSVPMIMNLPPMYCPSTSAFHSHDVVYNPLMYPSDLHFYYNARTEPTELCKKYDADVSYRVLDAITSNTCADSSGRKIPLSRNNILNTTKAETTAIGGDLYAAALLDGAECDAVADVPYLTSEIVFPMYQHPGCALGPALHNIPLHQALSPAYSARVIHPWSSAHFHKRRRKRKGYAEYAIIPQKVASPASLNKNKPTAASVNEAYSDSSQKRPSETVSTSCGRPLINELNEKMIKNQLCIDIIENNVGSEISSYTTALVENILLKAKEEIQFKASCTEESIQLEDLGENQTSPIAVSFNSTNEVVTDHKDENSKKCNENFGETVSIERKMLSETNDDPLSNNANNNRNITKSKYIDLNHVDRNINAVETKNESELPLSSIKDDMDAVNFMKGCASNMPNISEPINNSVENSIAKGVPEETASNAENIQNQSSSTTKYFDHENSPKNSRSFKNQYRGYPDEIGSLQNVSYALPSAEDTKLESVANMQKSNGSSVGKYSVAEENERHPVNRFHFSSDTFMHETELELNKLHQLTTKSEFQNQFIYKLAYDESTTDQSEVEDQEMPNEIVCDNKQNNSCQSIRDSGSRSEILVHEIDSASDAGSEDVELLPHRYESESAQRNSKHVYVNNLSLAVELLRTRESLPYDEEFKRIVGEDVEQHVQQSKSMPSKALPHKIRQSVVTNSLIRDPNRIVQNETSLISSNQESMEHDILPVSTQQFVPNKKVWNSRVSAKGVRLEDSAEEEEKDTTDESRLNPGEKADRNNFRSAQVRQQFHILASRTGIVNPCLCCIIL